MIIVVSPSFEDHCASTENPEADGNPSKETQKPKRPSIKPRVFLWEWAVMLVLASVCLSLEKKCHKFTLSQNTTTDTGVEIYM